MVVAGRRSVNVKDGCRESVLLASKNADSFVNWTANGARRPTASPENESA